LQALVKTWGSVAFLLAPPHVLPGDPRSLKIAMVAAILSNILVTLVLFDSQFLLVEALLDLALGGFCLAISLRLVQKSERFIQSFSAYCGANVVVNVVAMLLLAPIKAGQTEGGGSLLGQFVELLILVWSLAIISSIVRHTFTIPLSASIGIAICYLLVYIQMVGLLLGLPT